MTQPNLTGAVFEDRILSRAARLKEAGVLWLFKHGVMVSWQAGSWIPIRSKPDFGGVLFPGESIAIEAKVCSAASFAFNDMKLKTQQLNFLIDEGDMGGRAFLLIAFNEMKLKTKTHDAFTVGLPILPSDPYWQSVRLGQVKSISRDEARARGKVVAWNVWGRCRTAEPNLMDLFQETWSPTP